FATIVTGFVVAIPALFMNLTEVTDLTSIGTLFAFVLVCTGVLLLPADTEVNDGKKRFRMPYINSKFIVPLLFTGVIAFFYDDLLKQFDFSHGWLVIRERLPLYLYLILALVVSVLSFTKNLSLIPVLGLLSCGYLMTELGYTNWLRFLIWLGVGLVVYFGYSYKHSKLNGVEE
ncbi:MAG TPA: amino acid permease C-terminal domain-containing protein, partial [Pelobium sp.]|nr:amino acid permease C-terminal domain-containing protein [Pelobium sp.]